MSDDVYYQYNPWWEDEFHLEGVISRNRYIAVFDKHLDEKVIVILTGLRRVGKTTIMKLYISNLLHMGIEPNHIFYISCDDYVLNKKSIIDMISDYRRIHHLRLEERVFVFLDEVTYKDDFHQQLKNLHDTQNVKIFASSSSSSVLKDKSAFLTGREMISEIMPLDFNEFLTFRDLLVKKSEAYLLEAYFEEYLQSGGMPEYVLKKDREYLKNLVDDIIYKDIVAFHGIKSPNIVRELFSLLMERCGKQVSINKISNILKISPDTARRYLKMFEETYLIYLVPRHGKLNEQLLAPKKVYAADLGIRNLFTGFKDKGALFENLVFFSIKSKSPEYIYDNGIEIDFYTQDKVLIEAKYGQDLNEKQRKLFDGFDAPKKYIIKNVHDIEQLKALH